MLDFNRIKEIKLTDVVARYKIALRFRDEYAVCACPLPTHKHGDTGKSFSIHLGGNYWRCFSDSCNANNGGKRGGDVINFVALMEGCRERDAAQKLAQWYGVPESKTPQHMAEASKEKPKTNTSSSIPNITTSNGSAKRYMAETEAWFRELCVYGDESEDAYQARILKGLKNRCYESYQRGLKEGRKS
jgi:DNA primase